MTKRISQANTVVVPAVHANGVDGKGVVTKAVVVPAEAEIASTKVEAKADEPTTVVADAVAALAAPAPMAMVAEQVAATDPAATSMSTTQESDDGETDLTPYIVGGVLVLGGILAVALSSGDTDPIAVTPAPTNTAPTFTSTATATVAENAPITTVVYDANAADTQGNAIVFSISGTDAALFAIDPATGVVTLRNSANFEARPTYSFTVTATDNGSPVLSATQAVTVTVTNVNEAPTFTSATATATTPENIPTTTVVFTPAATDVDAGTTLVFTLGNTPANGAIPAGTDAQFFAINPATGAVTFRASPDFETRTSFTFTVTASDAATGGLSGTQTVTVNVTDVAEGPVFTSAATATVAENAAIATTVFDANATGATSFALTGADAALFNFDTATGIATLRSPANFEARSVFNVTVTATGAGGTTSQAIAVNVTDVNEAPTFAAPTAAFSVPENTAATQVIFTGVATDTDAATGANGRVTYSLTGADAGLFNVNATTGAVTFRTAPDFEAVPARTTFNFNVVATDAGATPLSASQAVTVTLTNVAEPGDGTRIDGVGIAAGSNVTFDAATGNVTFLESGAAGNISTINSFTAGDIITTDVATSSYSFGSQGSTLVISFNNNGVSSQIFLPNAAGNAFIFDEATAEQAVGFNFFQSTVAAPPPPPASASALTGTTTYSAANSSVTYTEDASAANVSTINNFTSDDRIVVTGTPGTSAATQYSFGSTGSDLTISFNNNGVSSQIVLVGAANPGVFVFDEASAERAVGFDFFRYG